MIRYKKIYCLVITALCVLLAGGKACAAGPKELLQYLKDVSQGGAVYEVIPDGSGDFSGIQEAVEQVESGATLLIYPGIYEENVEITDKTVNLVGAGRDECILISDTMDYHHVPLTIGAGVVYNMTICGSNPTKENIVPFVATDYDSSDQSSVYDWQSRFPGYAIHIDQDYSCDRELLIEGCRIISDSNQCVGIGCRGGNTITFADCQFYSNGGGCVFLHNTQTESGAGEAHFIMRDCELKNYWCPYVMSVHSMGDLNSLYLTFQNVRVSTVAYESKLSYQSDNMNTWYNVDQLGSPEVQKQLEAEGYYTTLGAQMIHRCDSGAYAGMRVAREREALLGSWPDLAEGIHYISISDHPDRYTTQKTVLRGEARQRQVIEIQNTDPGAPKDGWCGLYNIYLTEESYGNTLIEMNYPRTISVEDAE